MELKITRAQKEIHGVDDSQKKTLYATVMKENVGLSVEDNQYENQYDANNDYQIFGMGSNKTGGIQTMQEKMNMADKPKVDDSSDSDNTDRDQQSSNLESKTSSKGSNGKSTGAGSTPINGMQQKIQNELPEDKEIHSDVE